MCIISSSEGRGYEDYLIQNFRPFSGYLLLNQLYQCFQVLFVFILRQKVFKKIMFLNIKLNDMIYETSAVTTV